MGVKQSIVEKLPADMPRWEQLVRRIGKVAPAETRNHKRPEDSTAREVTRALAARWFVNGLIINGFCLNDAYRHLRPKATKADLSEKAWRWMRAPLVRRMLQELMRKQNRRAEIDLDYMVEEAIADANSSVMDYIKYDPETQKHRFDIDPTNYTAEQRRRIKGVKIFNGEIVEVTVPSPIQARKQLLEIIRFMSEQSSGTTGNGSVSNELQARLKRARRVQTEEVKLLNRPRVPADQLLLAVERAKQRIAADRRGAIDGEVTSVED